MGCPRTCAWRLACLSGEESQQPTCPHVKHSRRCTHGECMRKHSSQPSGVFGTTDLTNSRCGSTHAPVIPDHLHPKYRSAPVRATRPTRTSFHCGGTVTLCPLADRPSVHRTTHGDRGVVLSSLYRGDDHLVGHAGQRRRRRLAEHALQLVEGCPPPQVSTHVGRPKEHLVGKFPVLCR